MEKTESATENLSSGTVPADEVSTGKNSAGAESASGVAPAGKISAGTIPVEKISDDAISAEKIPAGATSAKKTALGAIPAEVVQELKTWLGLGAVNIFGLPMSGKDTQGRLLAETLGAEFLSSGDVIRGARDQVGDVTANGELAPTEMFRELVLPYFAKLRGKPLVLSSVGRWSGEEEPVMRALSGAGHSLKAVILLELTADEARERWRTARELGKREAEGVAARADDASPEVFEKRLAEFAEKTVPVLDFYRERGLLISVPGRASREEVFGGVLDALLSKVRE